MWGVSLTHPVLASFLSGEFLLHIPCWLHFYVGSFPYTSRASFIFIWGISLTHPIMASFLCGEFLLHTPCCLILMQGVSLTLPVLAVFCLFFKYFLSGEYLEHIQCSFLFNFLSGEFLLHIPCWLHFYWGSFSYTSRAGFIFMQGISHMLPSFLRREFV